MHDLQLEDMAVTGSFSNCTTMEAKDIRLLALTRGGTGGVGFVLLVLILTLVVCKKGLAGLRGSTQTRLMSYLLLSTAAYLLALSTQIEHYWNYTDRHSGNDSMSWKVSM